MLNVVLLRHDARRHLLSTRGIKSHHILVPRHQPLRHMTYVVFHSAAAFNSLGGRVHLYYELRLAHSGVAELVRDHVDRNLVYSLHLCQHSGSRRQGLQTPGKSYVVTRIGNRHIVVRHTKKTRNHPCREERAPQERPHFHHLPMGSDRSYRIKSGT